jgi:rpsU-divergently transcribed protein
MREELSGCQDDLMKLRIKERVHKGIKTRLTFEIPYGAQWPQAMALGMQPGNVPNTLKQIHSISDEIWYQAGDKAVDVSSERDEVLC